MSYVRNEPPWFSFLVHPRDIADIDRWRPSRVLRERSIDDQDFAARVAQLGPIVVGEILFGFGPVRGELIVVPELPEAVMGPSGARQIRDAVTIAAGRGARVIGLGGLIAPATGAGLRLVRHLPAGVTLTTGNAYTAVVARDNVLEACAKLSLARRPHVAILGATGSVGVPASLLLAMENVNLLLLGRNGRRLQSALGAVTTARLSTDLADLVTADVVLVLTNDPSAHVTPDMVAPGTVVIDVAQPPNVGITERDRFDERGVRVVDGGLVVIPGFQCTYDLGFSRPETTFACLAETYLLAQEGARAHSVGRATADTARSMEHLARRYGVAPVPLELRDPSRPVIASGRLG
jgi:fatty aldehyde-generating acyl-ACP reductase